MPSCHHLRRFPPEVIGERVLGLPKEPGNDKDVPFSQLLKNG